MRKVTIRDLRNHGGRVLQRVARGEGLIVTVDGRPVAELRPLPSRTLSASVLIDRWRSLPAVDALKLRRDLDAVLDAKL